MLFVRLRFSERLMGLCSRRRPREVFAMLGCARRGMDPPLWRKLFPTAKSCGAELLGFSVRLTPRSVMRGRLAFAPAGNKKMTNVVVPTREANSNFE
jgi:hypothetical protein